MAFVGLQGGSCGRGGGSGAGPKPGTKEYADALRSFYVGAAALQVGDTRRAAPELNNANKLIPGEPAILADLGILAIRNNQLDAAADYINQASKTAPNDSRIVYLQGVLKSRKGDFAGAAADFQRAADLNPQDLRAQYAVVEHIQRQGGPDADQKSLALIQKMLTAHPDNLALLLEAARLAAKTGDSATLHTALQKLSSLSSNWPVEPRQRLKDLQAAASGPNPRATVPLAMVLTNVLRPEPALQASYGMLHYPNPTPGEIGDPLLTLVTVPNPPATPAPPDDKLTFTPAPADGAGKAQMVTSAYLTPDAKPAVIAVDAKSLRIVGTPTALPFPGGASAPSPDAVCAADLFAGFHNDLIVAGAGGLRIYRQDDHGAFTDITAKTKLPPDVISAPAYGVWAADVDLEGDLDLVESLADGRVQVLRNNADGTFTPIDLFGGIKNLRQFAYADMDGDDACDAIMLDSAGALHVELNQRSNRFTDSPVPATLGPVAAFTITDVDDDGMLDIAALKVDGTLARVSHAPGGTWAAAEVGKWSGGPLTGGAVQATTRLLAADLDNNGGVDVVASTPAATAIWLHDAHAAYKLLAGTVPGNITSANDLSGTGRIDLVGLVDDKPTVVANHGTKQYAWQKLKPAAAYKSRGKDPKKVEDNERINPFGIGGTMEIRAGLLAQRRLITSPVVHFGLGTNPAVDVARIIWPNGVLQAEFAPQPNAVVDTSQRLTSSCPWIFAWDGNKIGFVTDFLWRSPLGLKINAQDTGAVAMTQDWVKIRGDQLVPKNGLYDLRITAELWETHFFDQVTLMTVDHPAGTEVFVDERFAIPSPNFGPYVTGPLHPFATAKDDLGADVSATVGDLDGKYLDTFGLGKYQGVTRDHFVEVELPKDAPASGPLWLVAQGWVHPTDSSLNVAMSQGNHEKPRGLSLEVPDGKGGWRVAKPNLGFPSGKTKTILIDLNGVFAPGAQRKARLRTNLEVYWDRLAWAVALNSGGIKTNRIPAASAELRYHGFSPYHPGPVSTPEIPDYAEAEAVPNKWSDLIGYCTRFGDVKELLEKVDDRYVIMNAGDEMALTFKASAPPPAGWVRDFILIGDGWEKDGNLNTTWSKTVLPLPSHDNPRYNGVAGRLEDDPVYRRHAMDWQRYHTRYITPHGFATALKPRENQ